MADKSSDGIEAVTLPGGSFDVVALDKALSGVSGKLEGPDRRAAIADAIASANETPWTGEALLPGYKIVRRGDVDKDTPFPEEMIRVYDPKLLDKQVKAGDVEIEPATGAAVIAPAAPAAPAPAPAQE